METMIVVEFDWNRFPQVVGLVVLLAFVPFALMVGLRLGKAVKTLMRKRGGNNALPRQNNDAGREAEGAG